MSNINLSHIYGACALGALALGYLGGTKLYDHIDWEYMSSSNIPERIQVCDIRGLSLEMKFGLSVNLRDIEEHGNPSAVIALKDSMVKEFIEPEFQRVVNDNVFSPPRPDYSRAIEDGVITSYERKKVGDELIQSSRQYSQDFTKENLSSAIVALESEIEIDSGVKIEISDVSFSPNLVDVETAIEQGHSFEICDV